MGTSISGLCWIDEQTLVTAAWYSGVKQLIIYTFNTTSKACTGKVIDRGYNVGSLSCSEDRKVYTTSLTTADKVKVTIYDEVRESDESWEPNLISQSPAVAHISVNAEFIVITVGNDSYLYDKNKVLQHKVTHAKVSETYLTDTSVFLGNVQQEKELFAMNLLTNEPVMINIKSYGLSGTKKGYVYVIYDNVADIGVYSPGGTFKHKLLVKSKPRNYFSFCGALRINDTESLIAFGPWNTDMITIYRIY